MSENLMQGMGAVLAQAREEKGMSVADVAEKLKLTVRQIEAIEAEDMSRLPAPVFVRGFVRNYARLLNLSVEAIPVAAEVAVEPTANITAPSEGVVFSVSPVKRWLLLPLVGLTLFMLLVAVLYNWLRQGEEAYVSNTPATQTPAETTSVQPLPIRPIVPAEPANPSVVPAPTPTPAQPAPASMPAAPASTLPAAPSPQPVSSAPAVPAQPKAAIVPATAVPAAPPVAAVPAAAAPQHASPASYEFGDAKGSGHVVRFVAMDDDTWIEAVAGDGKRYAQLLRRGDRMAVHGVAPLRLVVGNASHTTVTYDGKNVELQPHTGEKVARLSLQ